MKIIHLKSMGRGTDLWEAQTDEKISILRDVAAILPDGRLERVLTTLKPNRRVIVPSDALWWLEDQMDLAEYEKIELAATI